MLKYLGKAGAFELTNCSNTSHEFSVLVMAPELDLQKNVGRKLTKRRKPLRASSVQYPERFKEGEDAQDDVTATNGKPAQYMNQSVFSMIAAAGSKTDFNARFEGESSDSEEDQESSILPAFVEERSANTSFEEHSAKHEATVPRGWSGRQQAKSAESEGPPLLPKLKLRTAKEKCYMSQSALLPPRESSSFRESPKGITPRDAPLMSKMLEAQAELVPSTPFAEINIASSKDSGAVGIEQGSVSLATRLMEIFSFERPEEVISGKGSNTTLTSLSLADGICRISMLAPAKRSIARLHVYHTKAHLFFWISAKEVGELVQIIRGAVLYTYTKPEYRRQVWLSVEERTTEPKVPPLLVYIERGCHVVLYRPLRSLFPKWEY